MRVAVEGGRAKAVRDGTEATSVRVRRQPRSAHVVAPVWPNGGSFCDVDAVFFLRHDRLCDVTRAGHKSK